MSQFPEAPSRSSALLLTLTVARNFRVLSLLPFVAAAASVAISSQLNPQFTANTSFLPPQSEQSSLAMAMQSLGAIAGLGNSTKTPAEQVKTLLLSRTVQTAVIEEAGLREHYGKETNTELRKVLTSATDIDFGKDGVIVLSVTDTSSTLAAKIANRYVAQLAALLGALGENEATQKRIYLESKTAAAEAALIKAQAELRNTGVSPETIKISPEASIAEIAQLTAQITATEIRIQSMRHYLNESSPDLSLATAELQSMKSALREKTKSQQQNLSGTAPGDKDYLNAYRSFKYQELLYEMLAKQLEIARLDESKTPPPIRVIDPAIPPEYKSSPQRLKIAAITYVTTTILAFVVVLLRQGLTNLRRQETQGVLLAEIGHSFRQSLSIFRR